MNCKPGDLAVVVDGPPEVRHNIGKVVRVVNTCKSWDGVVCWRLEKPFPDVVLGRRGNCLAVADRDLRPIRDSDGEDEMLTIAGRPTETVDSILRELGA